MKTKEVAKLYEKYNDEFSEFEKVEPKRSQRPDLHAFLLIDELVPGNEDIISASEHDQFWISVDGEKLRKKLTEKLIIELNRCGVIYDEEYDGFYVFT